MASASRKARAFRALVERLWIDATRRAHREALERNPTLEAADAAIRVAQYNADAATGVFLPQVTLNSNSSYQIYSSDATSSTVT